MPRISQHGKNVAADDEPQAYPSGWRLRCDLGSPRAVVMAVARKTLEIILGDITYLLAWGFDAVIPARLPSHIVSVIATFGMHMTGISKKWDMNHANRYYS